MFHRGHEAVFSETTEDFDDWGDPILDTEAMKAFGKPKRLYGFFCYRGNGDEI